MSSRSRLIVLLLLLAIGIFIMQHQSSAKAKSKPVTSKIGPQAVPQPPRTSTAPDDKPKTHKPIRFSTKSKVRLKPGETAVLSYWEIEPGMNGIALVTPERLPDGNISLTTRILNITDQAVAKASAQDMFPDLFDFEHYEAVSPERLGEFLDAIQNADGANVMSYPRMVTKPGMQAGIRSVVNYPDGSWLGYSLSLQADPLAAGDGYDLTIDLDKRSTGPQ